MLKTFLKSSHALIALVNAFRLIGGDFRRFEAWLGRPKLIRIYLERRRIKKLQVGSGPNSLDGWLNTDFRPSKPGHVYLDATQRFPFPDETFDYVFSEHLLGEFPYTTGLSMLRQCWRVLKPAGKIRISTPNLEKILTLGAKNPDETQLQYIRWASDRYLPDISETSAALVLNYFFRRHTLVFVYSPELLQQALKSAGFSEIRFFEPGSSDDPNLAGIESHGKIVGDDINRFESMVVEAVRAPA